MTEIDWSRSVVGRTTVDDDNGDGSPKAHLLVERYSWRKRKIKIPERYATPEPIVP